jgi:hypothetical protein
LNRPAPILLEAIADRGGHEYALGTDINHVLDDVTRPPGQFEFSSVIERYEGSARGTPIGSASRMRSRPPSLPLSS